MPGQDISLPWSYVPIYGTWVWSDTGLLRPGTYKIISNAQVSSASGEAIFPKGVVKIGQLNVDEDDMYGVSFLYRTPAVDDPDIIPNGFQIRVEVVPEGAERVAFVLEPKLIMMDDGLDVRTAIDPSPPSPSQPTLLRGVPGGVAPLNANGQVENAYGQVIYPGGGGGGSDTFIEHFQNTPSASWSINHGLGRTPAVTLIVGGKIIIGDVEYTNSEQVLVTFAEPTAGKAILT